jgi:N-acetylmuramoyl-L-alanine amidase
VVLALSSLLSLVPPGRREARAQLGSLAGWSFMIDPGHGGSETGAVGPTGLMEKDVNLSVSLRLRDLLVQEGAVVYMTREDDSYVSITSRWQMANDLGVDRFISVHHNAVSDSGTNYTLTLISQYASDLSVDLANQAENELLWELGLPAASPPVWRVNYVGVLNHTNMPAILTEASFISNPAEEQRLRDPQYNQREAEAICRAVLHHCGGPNVYLIEPKPGGFVTSDIQAKVSVPEPSQAQRVDFYLDGNPVGSEYAPPFQHTLGTGSLPDGVYDLRAEVVYGSGQVLSTSTSLVVSNAAKRWYFAEGTTRTGFEEWLTLLNPNEDDVQVAVTYCFDAAPPLVRTYPLAAGSRLTLNVRSEVGDGRDVALQVDCPVPVVAERPMYFNYNLKWQGGHVALGANQPSENWYFAEGYTGEGFEQWLCVYNPGESAVDLEAEYQLEGGGTMQKTWTLGGRSRFSQYVNQAVGPGRNVSIKLRASGPVVAERPMYFNYSGKWQGGHVALGAYRPSENWYFAEGYTGSGFEEWLCLQNPGDTPAPVSVTFVVDQGDPVQIGTELAPRSRRTFYVNQEVGAGRQVSIRVASPGVPVIAERPIYYDYHGWARGGDIGNGTVRPSSAWFFAEGYTGEGFEEWLCLFNPQPEDVEVTLLLFLPENEVVKMRQYLPAFSRRSFNVNTLSYLQGDTAMFVLASLPVVAERPLYFKYGGGWSGGSLQSGYFPGMR